MFYLSKTDFKEYLVCPKCLWLKKKRPDDYTPGEFSDFLRKLLKDGYEVEDVFKQFFPLGVPVFDGRQDARKQTKELIEKQKTIFQATFKTDEGLFAKIDVLEFDDESEKWNLYEVKSGSEIKNDLKHNHIKDITFQKIVTERSGIEIEKSFLVHLNKHYVRKGELDLKKLFVVEEVSEKIAEAKQEVEKEISEALNLLEKDDLNVAGCDCVFRSSGQRCDCFGFFNPQVPEYSTAHIFQKNKLKTLVDDGIFEPKDVPVDFKMTKIQKTKIELQKNGVPEIDKNAIEKTLAQLEYPLYFLDYETFGKPIPLLTGYKPAQQLVFQYSLHVLGENGKFEHFEYLANELENATGGLVESLRKNIGSVGSVIVWYESFEKGKNDELGKLHSEHKEFLEGLNGRVFDLMKVFKKNYLHPKFNGSASIKKVLPVLVSELSYEQLDVQNGTMAIEAWGKTIFDDISQEEKNEIRNNLLKYCELDTLAMVKILEKLKNL